MQSLNMAKLAEQFDALAEAVTAISGTFRAATASGEGAAGNGKAAEPVRTRRKSKPAPAAEEETYTEDEVRTALKELAQTHGKDKMAEALASVGAGRLPDVDESQYAELMAWITAAAAEEGEEEEEEEETAKTRRRSKKTPALDPAAVKKAFSALVKADRAAAKRILKEVGAERFGDIEDDPEALQTVNDAVQAAKEGEEEDDIL